MQGKLTPLVSERDQNFRLDATNGRRFVVKIANGAEPAQITDFQIQALLHLEASACTVAVPKLVRTRIGGDVIEYRDCGREQRPAGRQLRSGASA